MFVLLVIIHVLMCFAIIAVVLLQAGKGADIGSAFGGGGTQAVFGSMGTPTILGKITGAVAVVFMLTSFGLTLLGGERATSVLREPKPAAAPTAPAPAAPAAPSSAPTGPSSAPTGTPPASK
jgi:preprotein translocase subunit SecG